LRKAAILKKRILSVGNKLVCGTVSFKIENGYFDVICRNKLI